MPVPPKRLSKGRTRRRRTHHALQAPAVTICSQCKNPTQPHTVCPSCGHYRGRDVLKLQEKVERGLTKKKQIEAKKEAVLARAAAKK